jgi:hypothetical protein
MHKSATKCNETSGKWCKNKHGASKIIDTLETYHPVKMMWYAPIIPRLKRLFRNKEYAKLLRWHMEDRKKDDKLRHSIDGRQLWKIEREFLDFAGGATNLWFGLITDGMNPFGEQICSHSTWLVTLCIYNLPPWLCMKRKFIMISVLIQGPKQPGNDIDV